MTHPIRQRFVTRFASTAALLGVLAVGAFFFGGASPAQAQSLDDAYSAKILPGWRTDDGRHMAAIEIKLAPGWKTYWRAPGDAGIPPRFDWGKSSNLSKVSVIWPTPEVMDQSGFQVIGYGGKLVLPLHVHPKSRARDVNLKGEIEIGVCKDICLPVTLQLQERLDRNTRKPDAKIAGAMANRPYSAKEGKVSHVNCSISPIEDGLRLTAEMDLPKTGAGEVAVIETDNPQVWVSQAETRRSGNRLTATSELFHVEGRSFALNRSGVRITVIGSSHAVDIQGCKKG